MKKISIYLESLGGGGIEEVSYNLATEFMRKGFVVDILVNQMTGVLLNKFTNNLKIVSLGVSRPRDAIFKIGKYLKLAQPDALIANAWPHTGAAILACRIFSRKTRILACDHTDLRESDLNTTKDKIILRLFGGIIYSQSHIIAAVSDGVADSISFITRFRKNKIHILHNPVRQRISLGHSSQDGELLNWWGCAEIKILSVGALKKAKSHDTLIKAIKIVSEKKNVRVIILGEGGLRSKLESLIGVMELDQVIKLPGFRDNPFPFYEHADLFVLSSSHEGFPGVLVEALSCGLPIVSTDCRSGPKEVLEDGKYGSLVPINDPVALAEAILSKTGFKLDSKLSLLRASNFSLDRVADRYLELLFNQS